MAKRALPLTALIRTLSHQQKICIAERRKVEVVNDSPRKRGNDNLKKKKIRSRVVIITIKIIKLEKESPAEVHKVNHEVTDKTRTQVVLEFGLFVRINLIAKRPCYPVTCQRTFRKFFFFFF